MAKSYGCMWAYDAFFRCNIKDNAASHATYDFGVCTVVSKRNHDSIEVVDLKNIFTVLSSGWNMIIMKVVWLKHEDEGRSSLKYDNMRFWTCKFSAREDRRPINPFLYPVNAHQVFFLEDVISPGWKIILRHELFGRVRNGAWDEKLLRQEPGRRVQLEQAWLYEHAWRRCSFKKTEACSRGGGRFER
ncbi:hypothetical protein KC19_VG190800 [Ceratodon purpureus]|uniref:Uncharacterized protein n=1 Tax=Ceratodon purpureus TaxID=3225 RepID=A0A8T0HRM6_CERPU|nr:hypothetical protein KC19_VG190800 [Ceratodon purpureus]